MKKMLLGFGFLLFLSSCRAFVPINAAAEGEKLRKEINEKADEANHYDYRDENEDEDESQEKVKLMLKEQVQQLEMKNDYESGDPSTVVPSMEQLYPQN